LRKGVFAIKDEPIKAVPPSKKEDRKGKKKAGEKWEKESCFWSSGFQAKKNGGLPVCSKRPKSLRQEKWTWDHRGFQVPEGLVINKKGRKGKTN